MSDDSTLVIYSKPDCPLCDEGLQKVEAIAARHGLSVEKVDIESDDTLFAAHRYRIPVLEFRGEELGWGRLSEKGIEHKLKRVLRS